VLEIYHERRSFLKYDKFRDVTFVFGAGASYAAGLPLQNQLLTLILKDSKISSSPLGKMVNEFIRDNFYFSEDYIPTLESVFGYLDYFIQHDESLGNDFTTAKILEIKEALIKLIHYIISERSNTDCHPYRFFWEIVKEYSLNISIITLNYDTLIDEAFDFLYPDYGYIDYCIHLMNYDWYDKYHKELDPFNWWVNPREPVPVFGNVKPRPIKIIKIHGSLNWKYCDCCNQVLLTPWNSKIDLNTMGFVRYDYSDAPHNPQRIEFRCPLDNNRFNTLIIPPSHIKNIRHPIINSLRQEAAREIRCTRKVVFVGYSFPEADIHVKALFRKNLPPETKIIVINRTINEHIRAAYHSLFRDTSFYEITFEDALLNDQIMKKIFDIR